MTESQFSSRRELREAERQGLIAKPEQVFDLPTGAIQLPEQPIAGVDSMLTRKKIREMERAGLLDPLTGAIKQVAPVADPSAQTTSSPKAYEPVLAESEEPMTSEISLVQQSFLNYATAVEVASNQPEVSLHEPDVAAERPAVAAERPAVAPGKTPRANSNFVAPPEFDFGALVVEPKRFGRSGIIILASIALVLGAAAAAAFMLGIFK
jgi:hypothetical protein